MSHRVSIVRSAQKELLALPKSVRGRVQEKLLALASWPRPRGSKKLRETNKYRIRVRDYRVVYAVDDRRRRVLILAIGHRRDVYR